MTETQPTRFRGKVAFVTGGSKGIGAGIGAGSHRRMPRWRSPTRTQRQPRLNSFKSSKSKGSTALALKADNASVEELQNAVAKAADSLGRLDIFVSNAGILTRGTIDCFSIDDFDRMVAVNIRGAFIGIQAASRKMNNGGRIIVIGSNTAVRTAFPGASIYSMTKAALNASFVVRPSI